MKQVHLLSIRLRLHEFLLHLWILRERLFPVWPWELEPFGYAGVGYAAEAGDRFEDLKIACVSRMFFMYSGVGAEMLTAGSMMFF